MILTGRDTRGHWKRRWRAADI